MSCNSIVKDRNMRYHAINGLGWKREFRKANLLMNAETWKNNEIFYAC